jgi:hypothetical protein
MIGFLPRFRAIGLATASVFFITRLSGILPDCLTPPLADKTYGKQSGNEYADACLNKEIIRQGYSVLECLQPKVSQPERQWALLRSWPLSWLHRGVQLFDNCH